MNTDDIDTRKVEPTITPGFQAAQTIERQKSLINRLNNYANDLGLRAKMSKKEDESKQLHWLKKTTLKIYKMAISGTATALKWAEQLIVLLKDLLKTGARPITETYNTVKRWWVGELKQAA